MRMTPTCRMLGVRRTRSFQVTGGGGAGDYVVEGSPCHQQSITWALSPRTRRANRPDSLGSDEYPSRNGAAAAAAAAAGDVAANGILSPQTDEECADRYQGRILSYHERELLPLREDLAEWMNQTLGCSNLTEANILESLANGVLLCELCRVLEKSWGDAGTVVVRKSAGKETPTTPIKPRLRGRLWPNARRGSFQARENVLLFLSFCRTLGLHETMLFECNDLVSMAYPRQVVVCLLDVARVAARAGAAPMSGLVALEAQIDKDESRHRSSSPGSSSHIKRDNEDTVDSSAALNSVLEAGDSEMDAVPQCSSVLSDSTSTSSLTKEVVRIMQETQVNCKCLRKLEETLKLQRVDEGKYCIAGKIVFVRLLRSHVMVRVGGGWETLQHFLCRHDPCSKGVALRPTENRMRGRRSSEIHVRPLSAPCD